MDSLASTVPSDHSPQVVDAALFATANDVWYGFADSVPKFLRPDCVLAGRRARHTPADRHLPRLSRTCASPNWLHHSHPLIAKAECQKRDQYEHIERPLRSPCSCHTSRGFALLGTVASKPARHGRVVATWWCHPSHHLRADEHMTLRLIVMPLHIEGISVRNRLLARGQCKDQMR